MARKSGGSVTMSRLRDRLRKRLTGIADSCSRLITTIKPTTQNFASQRMCPFCRLITPRSGRFCLECGKSLGNA
jgi:hypothetical protein